MGIRIGDFRIGKSKSGKRKAEKAGWLRIEDLRILKEGVGGFFAGDGGRGAVAGIDGGFPGKGQDLFSNAGKQLIAIASG